MWRGRFCDQQPKQVKPDLANFSLKEKHFLNLRLEIYFFIELNLFTAVKLWLVN